MFQRTGEFQESPQDSSAAGTGQAISRPKPPEDEKCICSCFTVCVWFLQCFLKVLVKSSIAPLKVVLGRPAGRLAEVV